MLLRIHLDGLNQELGDCFLENMIAGIDEIDGEINAVGPVMHTEANVYMRISILDCR